MSDTDKRVLLAIDRLKLVQDAEADQRRRELEDLQFQVPELQWPDEVKRQRGAQTVAGVPIPARPMLSIPTLDQAVQLVLNQEKAAQLGVQIHPLSEDADDDTAEVIQGLYRRIEVDSRANLARSWAYERAVKAGRGAYRVLKAYADDGGHFSDQKIVIKRMLYQEAAYFDPFAQEPDWSDGEWAIVTEWVPIARYKRLYPKSQISSLDAEGLASLAEGMPEWIRPGDGDDGKGYAILIAEHFYKAYDEKTRVLLKSGKDAYDDEIPEDDEPDERDVKRTEQVPRVEWCKVNAVEVLEEGDWEGKYIPIIPVIGRELIPFEGKRRWVGVIGPQKDAVRGFNYAASGAVESAALEPKAPFDVDPEEIEGYESWWQQANIRNFPYLPRKKFLHGQAMPAIGRIQADGSKMQINLALVQAFKDFIHTGTGAYDPTLGQQSSEAKSGRAVLALQQQHDQGTSHFLDNLAEISMTYEAKVVLDLIPSVYDRPGRVVRILDLEDNADTVMLNQPFTMQNGKPQAVGSGQTPAMGGQSKPEVKHYDLKKGRYGVVVSIGKAYRSRVEQGADELGQLFQAEPQLFTILGDLYLKFRDFPGHMEAAERVKKMLPPPLQEQDQQNAQAQAAQLQQQVQQMGGQLQQAQAYIQREQAKHDAAIQKAQIDAEASVKMQELRNVGAITVAQINAAAKGVQLQTEARNEAMATGLEQQHEAEQAAADRAHDVGMAAMEHDHALEQGQQAASVGAQASAQDHQQALEQGQQSSDNAMAQQANQAALQPAPEQGEAGA